MSQPKEPLGPKKPRFFQRVKASFLREIHAEPPRKIGKNVLWMLFGSLVLALGVEVFLIPMDIVAGGSSSLGMILHAIPGFDVISVENYVTIIYWGCFLIGLFTLGIRYSMKTLIVTVTNPLFLQLFRWIVKVSVIDGIPLFDLSWWASRPDAPSGMFSLCYVLAAVFGGILEGIGIGMAMVGGGSSGGTDLLTVLLHRYARFPMQVSSFLPDAILILIAFFVVNRYNLPATLVGIGSAFLVSLAMDKVFNHRNETYVALIASPKLKEMNEFILQGVGRGTTWIHSKGGYTGKENDLLEVCFDKEEYSEIMGHLLAIDPNAFVTVLKAREIVGYGFTRDTPEVEIKDLALSPEEASRILSSAKRREQRKARREEKAKEKKGR